MSTERPKYLVVVKCSLEDFESALNEYASEGYGLAFYAYGGAGPETTNIHTAVMKLKDEQVKLEEAEDVINVDITVMEGGEIKRRLEEGWVIVASFSKQVTMMKPKPKEASA